MLIFAKIGKIIWIIYSYLYRMTIEIPLTPMGAVRTTQRAKYSDPRYLNYSRYKSCLALLLKQRGIISCPLSFKICFILPFPVTYTKSNKDDLVDKPHTHKPDLDNMLKGFMDCFGKDDSKVHSVQASKIWGYEGKIILEVL